MAHGTLLKTLVWLPRIFGIATSLSIGLFALDAFSGRTFVEGLPGFIIHLVPSMFLLAIVALSWRREWIGAVVFGMLAIAYALSVPTRPDWMLAISGPLVVTAGLFLLSWWVRGGSAQPAASH